MNAALKKAIELERKGLEFYIAASGMTKNPLVCKTLLSLAREEVDHMMKIYELGMRQDGGTKSPDTEAGLGDSEAETRIKDFFEKTGRELLVTDKDKVDVIEKAMMLERNSYEFYDDCQKKSDTEDERRLYGELKVQESAHYTALANVHYYLTQTGDWLEQDESRVWSWMNL